MVGTAGSEVPGVCEPFRCIQLHTEYRVLQWGWRKGQGGRQEITTGWMNGCTFVWSLSSLSSQSVCLSLSSVVCRLSTLN